MMKETTEKSRALILFGFILNVVALILYNVFSRSRQNEESVLFIIYATGVFYFVLIAINNFIDNRWKIFKLDARHFFLLLSILTISCFSVNLEFSVFAQMPNWLIVAFFTTYISLGLQIFFPNMAETFKVVNLFFIGIGLVLSIYFTIYLMPYLPITIVGLLFFGMTIHLLIPLILLVTLIVHVFRIEKSKFSILSLTIGLAIPILIATTFAIEYSSTKQKIHTANASIITRPNNDLPEWVLLSQNLNDNSITETIMKGDLVYEMGTVNNWFTSDLSVFNEAKLHNPFVVISGALSQDLDISAETRIKILRTLFGNRHKATQKLWTGKDLSTSEVLTNIRVYPEYRMAYIEKIISIKNQSRSRWTEQEALYSFTLPEGSVASSLSLWINGKEEKSRLTTKAKADSAYTTIVGVEVRDPSVMYWQEGNRLLVNVFPCTPKENRRFKIGVTIPLKYKNDKLLLENVKFEGPVTENTLETTVLIFESENEINELEIPSNYNEITENEFQYTGTYVEDWQISFKSPEISHKSFSFGGNSYKISNLEWKNRNIQAQNIFLDINKSWTEEEFYEVLEVFKGLSIHVYNDKMLKLSEKNQDLIFEELNSLNFSLFPIHKMGTKSALIISKSTEFSPNYSDLKESKFITDVSEYLSSKKRKIYLYNLGVNLSPYLKTLKEFNVLNYQVGNIAGLKKIVETGRFPVLKTLENEVSIPVSNIKITKIPETENSGAPDHLLRLFSYNKIIQESGRDFFKEDFITEKLISLAEEAYIVSPVSSLIVLESKKDYERFDIDENKNSLGNATVSGHGGVPEPHEWALIIISILVVLVISLRKILL